MRPETRRITEWLPLAAIIFAYEAAGWVSRRMARPLSDGFLQEWDLRLFSVMPGVWMQQRLPRPALDGLELFYFSYYIFVPLAPWLLLRRNGEKEFWRLWICAGLGYLVCDLLFPWFPSTPPRRLWPEFAAGGTPQVMNLLVLDRFSVGGNVFPSAHVAATLSMALSHGRSSRWWFLPWALGIALSTVSGGYHYGVDAVCGMAVGAAAEWAGTHILRRWS
ncbi:MAG: phosphatase PAP2 family protein [Acidobacteria bacterium]|nr:phosphatase PAP2 family protein [Acidobacteriota bacterium]